MRKRAPSERVSGIPLREKAARSGYTLLAKPFRDAGCPAVAGVVSPGERDFRLDLLTPASTWAVLETTTPTSSKPSATTNDADDHGAAGSMPLLQHIVMFVCVVGPLAGLGGAIALLWRGGAIGWPEIWAMIVMYSLCG